LFPLWIFLWFFWRITNKDQKMKPSLLRLCTVLLIGIICIKKKEEYHCFLNRQPTTKIGYSIYIYRIP
ncbi:MAG: hypothetical protein LBE12_18475, partial [Planctomycetaceae bacterium]|nr:hypothetical protein [Planctomycetaceae bacterium]